MSDNRFSNIFKAREDNVATEPEATAAPSPAPVTPAAKPPQARKVKTDVVETKPLGRPRGKRSDGEHVQVTAYIRRSTHRAVKKILLDEDRGQEFSQLVEELLSKWLKSRT